MDRNFFKSAFRSMRSRTSSKKSEDRDRREESRDDRREDARSDRRAAEEDRGQSLLRDELQGTTRTPEAVRERIVDANEELQSVSAKLDEAEAAGDEALAAELDAEAVEISEQIGELQDEFADGAGRPVTMDGTVIQDEVPDGAAIPFELSPRERLQAAGQDTSGMTTVDIEVAAQELAAERAVQRERDAEQAEKDYIADALGIGNIGQLSDDEIRALLEANEQLLDVHELRELHGVTNPDDVPGLDPEVVALLKDPPTTVVPESLRDRVELVAGDGAPTDDDGPGESAGGSGGDEEPEAEQPAPLGPVGPVKVETVAKRREPEREDDQPPEERHDGSEASGGTGRDGDGEDGRPVAGDDGDGKPGGDGGEREGPRVGGDNDDPRGAIRAPQEDGITVPGPGVNPPEELDDRLLAEDVSEGLPWQPGEPLTGPADLVGSPPQQGRGGDTDTSTGPGNPGSDGQGDPSPTKGQAGDPSIGGPGTIDPVTGIGVGAQTGGVGGGAGGGIGAGAGAGGTGPTEPGGTEPSVPEGPGADGGVATAPDADVSQPSPDGDGSTAPDGDPPPSPGRDGGGASDDQRDDPGPPAENPGMPGAGVAGPGESDNDPSNQTVDLTFQVTILGDEGQVVAGESHGVVGGEDVTFFLGADGNWYSESGNQVTDAGVIAGLEAQLAEYEEQGGTESDLGSITVSKTTFEEAQQQGDSDGDDQGGDGEPADQDGGDDGADDDQDDGSNDDGSNNDDDGSNDDGSNDDGSSDDDGGDSDDGGGDDGGDDADTGDDGADDGAGDGEAVEEDPPDEETGMPSDPDAPTAEQKREFQENDPLGYGQTKIESRENADVTYADHAGVDPGEGNQINPNPKDPPEEVFGGGATPRPSAEVIIAKRGGDVDPFDEGYGSGVGPPLGPDGEPIDPAGPIPGGNPVAADRGGDDLEPFEEAASFEIGATTTEDLGAVQLDAAAPDADDAAGGPDLGADDTLE